MVTTHLQPFPSPVSGYLLGSAPGPLPVEPSGDAHALREQHIQEILAGGADGIVLLNGNWSFTYSNRQARDLIANGKEIVGQNLLAAYPDIPEHAKKHLRTAMQDRVRTEFENFYPAPIHRWFQVRAFPFQDGISVFFQDISERRRTQQLLRENEKLTVAGRLAASIAHEINNPLESITNLLYLIEGDDAQSPTSLRFIHLAQQELARIAHITINTLQYFRPATVMQVPSLRDLTESVVTMFQGRIRQSGVTVEIHSVAHPPYECVGTEIRQILANFLGNALDATPPGGRIVIRIRSTTRATGVAGILLTMADTGCGMSRETLLHLADAFYTTKESSGTGIGLWVSYDLIRKHRGQVRVRSRQRPACGGSGKSGTVFEIFFPYENGIAVAAKATEAGIVHPRNFRHLPTNGLVTRMGDDSLGWTP